MLSARSAEIADQLNLSFTAIPAKLAGLEAARHFAGVPPTGYCAVNALTQWIQKAGSGRLIAMIAIAAVALAALIALTLRIGQEEKSLLFANIGIDEASEITTRLEQANIEFRLAPDGTAVYVPRSKVLEARMMLSAEGLPARGSIGYEIFDRQDALGATQFQQNINRLRALEGELARTIASIDNVESARVHLVLPERQLFERDKQKPSASIVLKVRGTLSPAQVRAVRNLVAGAVPDMSAQRVTILDETGQLLAAAEEDGAAADMQGAEDRQRAIEERMRKTVQDIVESVVGPGAVRVQVSADMDFNRITQNSETFDPEGRVARSTQTSEETANSANNGGAATAGRNVPDGSAANGGGSGDASNRTEETINYEISRTTRTEVIEGGRLKRLSVAVAIDGKMGAAAEGQPAQWAPRDPAEMERITALVKSAMGFDEQRGDKVEVVNVQFAKSPAEGALAAKPGLFDFGRTDIMRVVEIVAALIAALALVFFVLRPMIGGILKPAAAGPGALAGPGAATAIAGPAAPAIEMTASEQDLRTNMEIARVKGDIRQSSLKQVQEIIEQHPEESVSILRSYLNNAA
jgi:flagellar M-ring protein FliF